MHSYIAYCIDILEHLGVYCNIVRLRLNLIVVVVSISAFGVINFDYMYYYN